MGLAGGRGGRGLFALQGGMEMSQPGRRLRQGRRASMLAAVVACALVVVSVAAAAAGAPEGTIAADAGLSGVIGISEAPNGDFWLVQGNANDLVRLSPTGVITQTVGSFGTAPGLFNLPSSVAVGPD